MIENINENLNEVQKQFEIKHVIGRGTFGTVFFGYWKTKSLDVAIKIITRNPKYKNREVQILKSLQNCDSIVKLLIHFEKKDHENNKTEIYLVMEYLPSTLLSAVRVGQKNKIDYERVKGIIRKIFQGLAYLDEKNVCHRDIKPSNILYDQKDGRIKLCDFGSAKLIKKGQKSITYICSRYYRAPQLILGCSQYSNKIDIWSAGCMITELLTMHPLFDGANNIDQMAKIIKVIGPPTKQDVSAMKVEYLGESQQKIMPIGLVEKIRKINNTCPIIFLDLIGKLIVYNPNNRLSPKNVLEHQLFK